MKEENIKNLIKKPTHSQVIIMMEKATLNHELVDFLTIT